MKDREVAKVIGIIAPLRYFNRLFGDITSGPTTTVDWTGRQMLLEDKVSCIYGHSHGLGFWDVSGVVFYCYAMLLHRLSNEIKRILHYLAKNLVVSSRQH